MTETDLVIIGAGPAGMAAALAARARGVGRILVLERNGFYGGILNQCIHNGFGLHYFGEELTGPEYAERFSTELASAAVDVHLDTMVLSVSPDRQVEYIGPKTGYQVVSAKAVILATGCRERTRGQISIPGTRPAGVLTAGAAQRYVNLDGYQIGRRIIVLGSGDIGLIMARRLTLEGAEVVAVVELMPYSSGLTRNIRQCLDDFDIPLLLSHTITEIRGKHRVEQVTVAAVDADRKPLPGSETRFDVDTVLLSVGLIPENELAKGAGIELDPVTGGPIVSDRMETSVPGIFACGNAVQVHDLVDYVSAEGRRAGDHAADLLLNEPAAKEDLISLTATGDITYVVPQRIRQSSLSANIDIFLRVKRPLPGGGVITVCADGTPILRFRRKHLNPGEMERLTLPHQVMSQQTAASFSISVEAP